MGELFFRGLIHALETNFGGKKMAAWKRKTPHDKTHSVPTSNPLRIHVIIGAETLGFGNNSNYISFWCNDRSL